MVQSKSALYFGLIPYLKKFGIRIYGLPAFPFPNNPQYIPLCLCRYSSGIHRSNRVFSESCPFISADAARQSNACRILLRIVVHRTAPLSFSYTQKRVHKSEWYNYRHFLFCSSAPKEFCYCKTPLLHLANLLLSVSSCLSFFSVTILYYSSRALSRVFLKKF